MFSYFYYGYVIYRVYEYSSLINTACGTCNRLYGIYKWIKPDQRKFDLIATDHTESDWDLCEEKEIRKEELTDETHPDDLNIVEIQNN